MIYVETFEKECEASQLDDEIGSIVVPEGYKVKILELGFTIIATTWIYCYIGEVRIVKYHGSYKTTTQKRILMDLELVAGQTFKITATTVAGGQNTVLVVYDKS